MTAHLVAVVEQFHHKRVFAWSKTREGDVGIAGLCLHPNVAEALKAINIARAVVDESLVGSHLY